jgi:hypothetical protein
VSDAGGPRRRIWPWILVPLLIVAAAVFASARLLPGGSGLSESGNYSVR